MANDKKKKNQKKTTAKRSSKASAPKPKATKPTAKKATPKSTADKKQVKASTSKPKAQKSVNKQSATKKTTAKKTPQKRNTLKPDWNYEKDKPKTTRGKKEEIIINIPKKPTGQPKNAKSVTKQVTDQLPDNAKLRTIHLHFKID